MKRYSVDGKKRFTVKYPDGTIERFGTCDDKQDERYDIIHWNGLYFLTQYQKDDKNYSEPDKQKSLLPDGALVTNGYYEHEWDTFVTPKEWIEQP